MTEHISWKLFPGHKHPGAIDLKLGPLQILDDEYTVVKDLVRQIYNHAGVDTHVKHNIPLHVIMMLLRIYSHIVEVAGPLNHVLAGISSAAP